MRRLIALAGVAGLTLALAAPVAGAQDKGTKAFCKVNVRIQALFLNEPPGDADADAIAEWERKLDKALTRVENRAPAELSDDVETAVGIARASIENDSDPYDDPDFSPAITAVDEYLYDNCGYEQIEVTGTEYEFDGIPDTVDAGTVAVSFTNDGAELHEVAFLRLKGDVSVDDLEDLLAVDDDEFHAAAEFRGAAWAEQGQTGYLLAKLRPGRYAAVCFVPVGVESEADFETVDAPPHLVEGMTAEFTVEK